MKKIFYLSLIWILSITTTWADCPDVTGLFAAPVSNTEVLLTWDAIPNATHYQLKVELEEGAAPYQFWLSLSDNSYILDNLVAGGVYKFKVRTVCGGEKASWSEFQFFSTNGSGSTATCEVPGQLTASLDANGMASLSWDASPGALLYEVEVESEENTPFFVQEFLTTDNFIDIPGLEPNGLYKFKVKSQCGGSNSSDFTSWLFFSSGGNSGGGGNGGGGLGGSCETPTGLSVLDITTGSALISWDAVPGAEKYEVQVEDEENTPLFNWEVIVSSTEVTVTGLEAGGSYKVKVKTKCSGGNNSAYSDWLVFSAFNFTGNGSQSSFQLLPKEDKTAATEVRLSPNPVVSGEMLLVDMEKPLNANRVWVMVYDLQGHLYRTTEIPADTRGAIQIPTEGLRAGMYQVVVRSGKEIQSRRFSLLD